MEASLASGLPPCFEPLLFRFRCSAPQHPDSAPEPLVGEISSEVRGAVRALLRFGGHKPSGRGRPASESLAKALVDGAYPQIHPVVDFFNSVSVVSGLPISVLDASKIRGATQFRIGNPGEAYVFNPSGQELSLKGLLLVADQDGPIGTPVKDAQRTKISDETQEFFVAVWATRDLPEVTSFVTKRVHDWLETNKLILL